MQKIVWRLRVMWLVAAAIGAVPAAHADDPFLPCWRNKPGTTYQSWSFVASNNPAAPESFNNPNGTPSMTFTQGLFSTGWRASTLGKTGVWDLGRNGSAGLSISNYGGLPNSWKYAQVQVTYFDDGSLYAPPVVT